MTELGGKPNVVSAVPEIVHFEIKANHDFIILASDGIFDTINNQDSILTVWLTKLQRPMLDIHNICGLSIENLFSNAIKRSSPDNISAIMIAFNNFNSKINSLGFHELAMS